MKDKKMDEPTKQVTLSDLKNNISITSPTFREEIEKYSDFLYSKLAGLSLDLDTDPLAHGPGRLTTKTADARNYLSVVTQMNIEVSNALRGAKRQLIYEEGILELKIKEMIINDSKAKAFATAKEREYYCQLQNKEDFEKLSRLKEYVHNLEFLMEAVKLKITDLKDLQVRIQNQVRLCQDEIAIGNKWGSNKPSLSPKKEEKSSSYQNFKKELEERRRLSEATEEVDSDCQTPEVLKPMKSVDNQASKKMSADVESFLNQ